jgi:hypothetical protein
MKSKSAIELLETWPVMEIGSVAALAIRPARSLPPQRADRVVALGGAGLAGDVHADPLSPRQLLLAGSPAYQSLDLPAHALRENLLLNLDTARLRSGHVLQVGCNVRLRLMFQCEACGRLDLQHPSLARALGARRGMLARVVTGGEMLPGDLVRDLGPQMPPWSDDWRARRPRAAPVRLRIRARAGKHRQQARSARAARPPGRKASKLARSSGPMTRRRRRSRCQTRAPAIAPAPSTAVALSPRVVCCAAARRTSGRRTARPDRLAEILAQHARDLALEAGRWRIAAAK